MSQTVISGLVINESVKKIPGVAGATGMADATVDLLSGGKLLDTTKTGADGTWKMTVATLIAVQVRIVPPNGYEVLASLAYSATGLGAVFTPRTATFITTRCNCVKAPLVASEAIPATSPVTAASPLVAAAAATIVTYGPAELGLSAADIVFEDTFQTVDAAPDDSLTYQQQLWFGTPGTHQQGGSGFFANAKSTPAGDPFALSKPGLLDVQVEPYSGPDIPSYPNARYTAGVLTTVHSFWQLYGYFEIDVKCAGGRGAWNSLFLYPVADYPHAKYTGWEWDIYEITGAQPARMNTSTHWKASETAENLKDPPPHYTDTFADGSKLPDFTQGFHKVGALWTPGGFKRYIDGKAVDANFQPMPAIMSTPGYILLSHDADIVAPEKPCWYENNPDATTYRKSMQVRSLRAFRTADTKIIGGKAARVQLGT